VVQDLLNSAAGQSYIQKASDCFGVTIAPDSSGLWDVTAPAGSPDVNPYDNNPDGYSSKDCDTPAPADCTNDTSDACDWLRVRFFVLDTETMNSMSCYEGDDEACTDVGFDSTGASSPGSGPGTATQDPSKIEQGSDADLSKKLLTYKASGQYNCDNSGDCTQLEQMANGQSIQAGACQVSQLDPRVLQLLLYLIEVGNFKIGTFAMCSDHSFDSSRGHSGGFAVDISSVNGQAINSDSPATKTQALALDKFLDNLPAALKLNQQIDWGYGDHPDTDIQAYQQFNGQVCGSSCEQYYTLTVEEEHENHTHAGF
jgi:hypothetical protein